MRIVDNGVGGHIWNAEGEMQRFVAQMANARLMSCENVLRKTQISNLYYELALVFRRDARPYAINSPLAALAWQAIDRPDWRRLAASSWLATAALTTFQRRDEFAQPGKHRSRSLLLGPPASIQTPWKVCLERLRRGQDSILEYGYNLRHTS